MWAKFTLPREVMFEEKYTFDLQKNIWYCHGISDLAFAFVIIVVGQMYIEQFTNGKFFYDELLPTKN